MAGANPFSLLTDSQFGALFYQAIAPVYIIAQSGNQGIQAMMNGQMTPVQLNPQILAFQAAYNNLQPYFTELAARAAAGT